MQAIYMELDQEVKHEADASLLESMIVLLFEEKIITEDTYRQMLKESRM